MSALMSYPYLNHEERVKYRWDTGGDGRGKIDIWVRHGGHSVGKGEICVRHERTWVREVWDTEDMGEGKARHGWQCQYIAQFVVSRSRTRCSACTGRGVIRLPLLSANLLRQSTIRSCFSRVPRYTLLYGQASIPRSLLYYPSRQPPRFVICITKRIFVIWRNLNIELNNAQWERDEMKFVLFCPVNEKLEIIN